MSILFQRLYWTLESQWWVVHNHAPMLETCAAAGSFTARLISIWAPLMCFPQWFAIGMGTAEGYAIFAARYSAMCIVRYLDGKIPCTRALGICHISTLGPLLLWLVLGKREDRYEQGDISASFLSVEIKIIALCVFMDIRDFLLHMIGYPYPCYIRVAVQAGAIKDVTDVRARAKVHWWSAIVGP
ncbi:expressed unknown protein [Seminavis robusta]|uniref:Uncharacterized protein n=1 Tax=Seminavis robusta TaxID=568900 RepID=A0A9N8F1Y7_9STRA|nr:expressed unknown protein [Seminavis robusta]|eukprot:Sro3309_g346530.1 n/a (185) ;mRNA; f:4189-4743